MRTRLGLKGGAHVSRQTRYWVLGLTFVAASAVAVSSWLAMRRAEAAAAQLKR